MKEDPDSENQRTAERDYQDLLKKVKGLLESGVNDIRAEPLPETLPPELEAAPKKEVAQIIKDKDKEKEHKIRERELLLDGLAADIDARKTYANRIFWLIVAWLSSILLMLLLEGFLGKREIAVNLAAHGIGLKATFHFDLSDPVLLALIGGTTGGVVGLFVIVANYFFPKRH